MVKYKVNSDGKIDDEAVFQPLVYTAVYGSDVYYESLMIFLESIVKYGKYDGKIAIFSDRKKEEMAKYIPESVSDRVVIVAMDHKDYSQRYVSSSFAMEDFSPIIYFDNDIVFNSSVHPILQRVAQASGICVVTENESYPEMSSKRIADITDDRRIGNWWGLEIIRSDSNCSDKILPLANSGIIGWSDYCIFRAVGRLVFDLYHSKPNEGVAKWFGDQPFLNYALVRTGLVDYEALRNTCRFLGSTESFSGERRGLVHFNWARNEDKPRRMRAYMDYLILNKVNEP
ncbi:hypothetical protein [Mesorhizobium sp. ES1-3]|uniref:hypothetical protein n=1 Tax=Mesorhizobium sp. ES1-3 TaxID=2876628 RepID=UPI001CCC144E|nr:hypothetical protein [Mesorhizobium sp. ES1-3]MBZ9668698.1 hypothetical protein [Mesorhizobium sp. ES1-3]